MGYIDRQMCTTDNTSTLTISIKEGLFLYICINASQLHSIYLLSDKTDNGLNYFRKVALFIDMSGAENHCDKTPGLSI